MPNGRWLLATNRRDPETDRLYQSLNVSLDGGSTWDDPADLAPGCDLELDEASMLRLPDGEIVSYERTDSGHPLQKLISRDDGASWEGPFAALSPTAIGMPCQWRVGMSPQTWASRIAKRGIVIPKTSSSESNHRFIAQVQRNTRMMETDTELVIDMGGTSIHTYAFLEPVESALCPDRSGQQGLLLPLDVDTSPYADSGSRPSPCVFSSPTTSTMTHRWPRSGVTGSAWKTSNSQPIKRGIRC